MNSKEREDLKQQMAGEIEALKLRIESLTQSTKPVAPDNAIGRITRMEAISSKSVGEASLNSSRNRLAKLESALKKIDRSDFGICARCSRAIPLRRILAVPESLLCVSCVEEK